MSREHLRIRPAEKKDFKALVTLEKNSFQKDAFSPRRIRYLVTIARSSVLVLEKNKELIGAAYLLWHKTRSNGRIYNIVITPKLQGKGYGEKLLKECQRLCKRRHCRYISLEVRVDNKPAIAFYKKHRFEIILRLPEYYEDGTAGWRMLKTIRRG